MECSIGDIFSLGQRLEDDLGISPDVSKAFAHQILGCLRDLPTVPERISTGGISITKNEMLEVLNTPFEDLPLFLSGNSVKMTIAAWRLQAGK